MTQEILSFSLPKIGEEEKNIQDRFESSSDGSLIAIADGAGSSLYPRKWADILVKSFCQSSEDPIETIKESYQEWLKPLQEEWRQYYLAKIRAPHRKWWEGGSQIKDRGSSTFIGLRFQGLQDLEKREWQAVAVGDSCLFKLERKTDNLQVFPVKNSKSFKRIAKCFESLPEYQSSSPEFEEGWYEDGDIFLLATDALAQWILRDYENQSQEWRKVSCINRHRDFVNFIAQLRQKDLIENDDTTVAMIKIGKNIQVSEVDLGNDEPR